jgi:hypothetical protein
MFFVHCRAISKKPQKNWGISFSVVGYFYSSGDVSQYNMMLDNRGFYYIWPDARDFLRDSKLGLIRFDFIESRVRKKEEQI